MVPIRKKFLSHETYHPLQLAFGYSFIIGLGFFYDAVVPFSVIALLLVFRLWLQVANHVLAFKIGAIVWGVKVLIVTSFIWSIYPVYWLSEVVPLVQLIALFCIWSISFFIALLVGGICGSLIFYIYRLFSNKWISIPFVAFIWVLSELIFSIIHAVATIGPGVPIQTSFTFGYVGYLLVAIPGFNFVALLGGVYALSFLVIVICQIAAISIKRISRWLLLIPIIKVVILSTVLGYILHYEQKGISIATIETSFRLDDNRADLSSWEERFLATHSGVMEALKSETQYILLPEDSRYISHLTNHNKDPDFLWDILQLRQYNGIIIDSSRQEIAGGAISRGYYYKNSNLVAFQDKNYLTPYGEYHSYWLSFIIKQLQLTAQLREKGVADYRASAEAAYYESKMILPITFFCSEVLSPTVLFHRLKQNKDAPFIFHPISHAWFWNTTLLEPQLDRMLRVHAIFNRVPIVTVANMGEGKVYLPDGKVITPAIEKDGQGWRLRIIHL
jgi:hypothetical protein